jgi:HEAT repeat protein
MRNRREPGLIPVAARLLIRAGLLCLIVGTTMAAGDDVGDLQKALNTVSSYQYGDSRESLAGVSSFLQGIYGRPDAVKAAEKEFIRFLESDATLPAKRFISEQLSLIGSEASVPLLTSMALDPATSDMARFALERIPGPAVDKGLCAILPRMSGNQRIGIINTLGVRRSTEAVSLLVALASDRDRPTAASAINALGEIAHPTALKALKQARRGTLRKEATDAYVRAADRMAEEGKKKEALAIYRELNKPSEPETVRLAAMRGETRLGTPRETMALLTAALRTAEPGIQAEAIRLLGEIPGRQASEVLTNDYRRLAPSGRIQVLAAFALREEKSALPLAMEAVRDPDGEVRVVALETVGTLGNASTVPSLAETAATRQGAEQAAARLSLARLRGDDVDNALLEGLEKAQPQVKVELLRAVGERRLASATDTLLKIARDPNREVRREAVRALRTTAEPKHVPDLLALLRDASTPADRTELERTLASTIKRNEEFGVGPVVSTYKAAREAELRASLLLILGNVGDPAGLPLLKEALQDNQPEVARAAVLGLTEWPSQDPMPDLLLLARQTSNPSHQVLALRGYIKLTSLSSRRPAKETVALLAEALPLARQPEEKKAILGLLPRYACPEALHLASGLVDEEEVAEEAKQAVARIKQSLDRR